MRNAYKILIRNVDGSDYFVNLGINIRLDLKEKGVRMWIISCGSG
jgi:hypothetical protein